MAATAAVLLHRSLRSVAFYGSVRQAFLLHANDYNILKQVDVLGVDVVNYDDARDTLRQLLVDFSERGTVTISCHAETMLLASS